MEVAQLPRASAKDEDAKDSVACLGCCLRGSPPRVDPDHVKTWRLMLGVLGMPDSQFASPLGLNAHLRVAQWFAVLSRPLFSCFSDGYVFVRREPGEME